jgi:cytochrome c553
MSRRRISRTVLLFGVSVFGAATMASVSTFGQQVRSTPERLAQMERHFGQVSLIHEALIRGDLRAVREPARILEGAEAPRDVAAATAPHVAAMRLAATRAVDAQDLASVAAATASMLLSCGDCHRTAGTMPVPATPKRPDIGGLVGHMLEHQRAADEMLEGLFIPSETQWIRGATRFVGAPLRQQSLPRDQKVTPETSARVAGAPVSGCRQLDSDALCNEFGCFQVTRDRKPLFTPRLESTFQHPYFVHTYPI